MLRTRIMLLRPPQVKDLLHPGGATKAPVTIREDASGDIFVLGGGSPSLTSPPSPPDRPRHPTAFAHPTPSSPTPTPTPSPTLRRARRGGDHSGAAAALSRAGFSLPNRRRNPHERSFLQVALSLYGRHPAPRPRHRRRHHLQAARQGGGQPNRPPLRAPTAPPRSEPTLGLRRGRTPSGRWRQRWRLDARHSYFNRMSGSVW